MEIWQRKLFDILRFFLIKWPEHPTLDVAGYKYRTGRFCLSDAEFLKMDLTF